jgi:hypothetical protein
MLSHDGFLEVPCARCGRTGTKIQWGDVCPVCRDEKRRRASRIGRRAAVPATIAVGAWVLLSVPSDVPVARIYGMVAVVATYVLVRRIVSRIAQDFVK